MGASIDKLSIEITGSADRANEAISELEGNLRTLSNALGGFKSVSVFKDMFGNMPKGSDAKGLVSFANTMQKLSTSMSTLQGIASKGIGIEGLRQNIKGLESIKFDASGLSGISNLANSISKIGSKSGTTATANLIPMTDNLKRFVTEMNGVQSSTFDAESLSRLASSISKIGGIKVSNATTTLPQLTNSLKTFVTEMNKVEGVSFNTEGLSNLANSISRLGTKTSTVAVENIPKLQVAIKNLLTDLSKAPAISDNTVRSLEAMANIAQRTGGSFNSANNGITGFTNKTVSNFDKIKNAASKVVSAFGKVAVAAGKVTGINRIVNGVQRLVPASNQAQSGIKGLAMKFGTLYASAFMVTRVFGKFKGAIESAMDYVETYDYFRAAFNQVAASADLSKWKELGYKSAEEYANSFEERAKAVTKQLSGFEITESGALLDTGTKSLGLNPKSVMDTQALFGQMSSSMGVASDTATKLSRVLTEIGGDLASVKNMSFGDVWENLSSGLVGMSRAVDKYGVNIRNANMQQELMKLGIDANITKLGQQDKALLRTIIILNSTKYAWGNLADTINSPANSIRIFQENMASVSRTLGSIFLPVISKVMPYVNGLAIAIRRLVEYIAKLLGVDMSDYMKGLGGGSGNEMLSDALDAADEANDTADAVDNIGKSADKAAKKQKKFNKQLQAFDELNNLTTTETEKNPKTSTPKASTSGVPNVTDELTAALDDALSKYQKVWDKAYKRMQNKAENIANKIQRAFKRAWTTGSGEEIGKAIAKFVNKGLTWVKKNQKKFNKGLKNIASILGTGLKGFIEDLDWSDLGEIIGNGIKGFLEAETEFFDKMDWTNLGKSLATSLNSAIKTGVLESYFENMASKLRAAIETAFGFVTTFDFDGLGTALGNGINKFFKKMSKINPETGLNGWQELGQTISTSIAGIAGSLALAIREIEWVEVGEAIVDMISSINFAEIGWNLGSLVRELVNAVYELVSNKEMWKMLGQKIADGINGFFSSMNQKNVLTGMNGWQTLGLSLTRGINGIADAIITALDGVHWEKVGQAIADLIGSIDFKDVVWKLGKLATSLKSAIKDTLKGALKINDVQAEVLVDVAISAWAIKKLSKTKLVGSILDKLGGKVSVVFDAVKFNIKSWVAKALGESKLIAKIKNGLSFLKNGIRFGEVAMKIAKFGVSIGNPDMLADEIARNLDMIFTENIWNKICDLVPFLDKDSPFGVFQLVPPIFIVLNFGKAIVKVVGDIASVIGGFFEDVWSDTENTTPIDVGNDIANGILNGIKNALVFPASLIYNLIIKPFKNALGIHSPSKVAEKDIGKNIATGIVNGIKSLPKNFKEKLDSFKSDVLNWFKTKFKLPDIKVPKIGDIKQAINNMWNKAVSWFKSVKDKLPNIKVPSIGSIKDTISKAWNTAKTWWSTAKSKLPSIKVPSMGSIADLVKSKWQAAKTWWDKHTSKFNIKITTDFATKALKSAANLIIGTINSVFIDTLNKIHFKIPKIAVMGKTFFKGADIGFNLAHIKKFAQGGFPKTGELFIANEAGPELIGKINNKNAVAPQDDIAKGISDAVFNVLNPLMTRMANAIVGLEQSMNNANSGNTLSVEGVSDGDIVRIVKNENTAYRRRTGKGIFA